MNNAVENSKRRNLLLSAPLEPVDENIAMEI